MFFVPEWVDGTLFLVHQGERLHYWAGTMLRSLNWQGFWVIRIVLNQWMLLRTYWSLQEFCIENVSLFVVKFRNWLLTLDTIVVGRVSSKCCLQAKVSENAMALDVVILSNLYHILDSPSGKKSICHNLESQKSLILFCVVPFSRNFAIYFCSFIIYH